MESEIMIKGMVCERCIFVINEGITTLGYVVNSVSLGKISLESEISKDDYDRIEAFLKSYGFELMARRQVRIVRQVKDLINGFFWGSNPDNSKIVFSKLLSASLHMNYDSISELFSRLEGITLEKYIISRRLEKVKELLVYTNLTLTEIAHITGFSSINHLSRQFKELTGLSPSHFKVVQSEKEKLSHTHAIA
jgi:AraC family transcriptional regulator